MSNHIKQVAVSTKLVEVRLAALTRVEYMEVVEVPVNITQAELDELVNARYSQVDGGEFTNDPDYWQRATCEAVDSDMPDASPTMMVLRTEHGLQIERADASAQSISRNEEWKKELTKEPGAFNYQLLARLKQDCEYYLGYGNRVKKHLWAGSEVEQIAKMRELYEGFSVKPDWISLEDISRYEAEMIPAQPIG